eukprot:3005891-Amphidinium_carterae.4
MLFQSSARQGQGLVARAAAVSPAWKCSAPGQGQVLGKSKGKLQPASSLLGKGKCKRQPASVQAIGVFLVKSKSARPVSPGPAP